MKPPKPTMIHFLRSLGALATISLVVILSLPMEGCISHPKIDIPPNSRPVIVEMEVTAYDSGPESCGWKRNWYGRPVYAYGSMKGKPKAVGITASGVRAQPGTLAADTSFYPMGTVMDIPGYGRGVVEDRGGAIKGAARLDLWYPTRRQALQWGRRRVKVTVYLPAQRNR
jgi:3D (Asp-Asp-Asp) domain-containing protein